MYLRGQMNGLAARGACVCALAAALCAAGCLHHAGWLLQHTNSLYWRIYLFAPAADLCYTLRTLIYCKLNNFVFGSALAAQLPQLSLTLFLVILHVLFRRVCVCVRGAKQLDAAEIGFCLHCAN
jgi:hypothetical protein